KLLNARLLDADYYYETRLRDKVETVEYYMDVNQNWHKSVLCIGKGGFAVKEYKAVNNWQYSDTTEGLFTLSFAEMTQLALDVGLTQEDAFSVQVYPDSESAMESTEHFMNNFGCAK
ncbi:MAG: hypothetical protein R8K20_01555, partial [Gallionellaceae bacterium]